MAAAARKLIERIDSGSPPDEKEAEAIMQPPPDEPGASAPK
jgi:hypothetical protein